MNPLLFTKQQNFSLKQFEGIYRRQRLLKWWNSSLREWKTLWEKAIMLVTRDCLVNNMSIMRHRKLSRKWSKANTSSRSAQIPVAFALTHYQTTKF